MRSLRTTAVLAVLAACCVASAMLGDARAATLYFSDAGGPKSWSTSTANWSNSSGGSYNLVWTNGSDAWFEGTSGVVTVASAAVSAHSITFGVDGYTIQGEVIAFTTPGSGLVTTSGGTDTINSRLAGSAGLTKDGPGTLVLGGANNYTGTTTLKAGVLQGNLTAAQNIVANGSNDADIQGGKAIFDYTGSTSPASYVLPLLQSGAPTGWRSGRLRCSTSDALHGLGWSDSAATKKFTVAYAFYGDANLDGKVDINDLNIVLANYDKTGMNWSQADTNYDGKVDINDLNKVLANYDRSLAASPDGIAAAPEPSSLVLLAFAAAGLGLCQSLTGRFVVPPLGGRTG